MRRFCDGAIPAHPSARHYPRSRSRSVWLILAAATLAVIAAAVLLLRSGAERSSSGPPLIMLVDSTLPERIYSSESRANGATNADDLTDVLRDLPVTLVKENTNALWSREDQVIKEHPALIISHRSAFAAPEAGLSEPELERMFALTDRRIQTFIGYVGLGSRRTKFIIYSRNWQDVGGGEKWVQGIVTRYPHVKGRVSTVSVTGAQEPSFRDSTSKARIRQAVIRDLSLPVSRP